MLLGTKKRNYKNNKRKKIVIHREIQRSRAYKTEPHARFDYRSPQRLKIC